MQDRVKVLLMLTSMMVLFMSCNIYGYTGKGTKANPYIVSTETELRGALTEHQDKTSWIYIAVDDTIAITKTIEVEKGKYRIYASKGNQTIRRTTKLDAKVNDSQNPKYCMRIIGDTQIVFGYNASNYTLILNGSSSSFNSTRRCSGWLYVQTGATCTIDVNCHMKNVINNKFDQDGAPLTSRGDVVINGEISECIGMNGGAVKSVDGTVKINSSAKIHNCTSLTEGGAMYASIGGSIIMSGGQIYNCTASEEGGAIFVKGTAECKITGGYIRYNKSGASAGGIFSGYGAVLTIGTASGNGPEISYNTATGSGGGIRCNGGSSETAGGTTYIYGGNIHHNNSGKLGGGIACGEPGNEGKSRLIIKNAVINNNTSSSDGGGIWLPIKGNGIDTNYIILDNCKIKNNSSSRNGGAIMLRGVISASNNEVSDNTAQNKGGAVCIDSEGSLTLSGGSITRNKATVQGSGIFVKGKFKILSNACVDTNNIVYLSLNTYIDVIGKLNKTNGYIAQIDSEEKTNGTILVKADYSGTSASKELYYSGTADDEYEGKTVVKKYLYYGLEKNRSLRPSEKVNGYNHNYIILSEKYSISYDKNTTDDVEQMPKSQVKFWEENIIISNNNIIRQGYGIDDGKHWNLKKDGSGVSVKPGSEYTLNENSVLYAQWLYWMITAKDRFYVVGQNIVLDKKEILKKVSIENDKNSDVSYTFHVKQINKSDGSELAKGSDIATDDYMNTLEQNHYIVTFGVNSDKSSSTIISTMNVYIMEVPIVKNYIRFISLRYIDTLQKDSRWSIGLKEKLVESLEKKEGQSTYKINISNGQLREIKNNMRDSGYKITREMNKKLSESW